MKFPVDIGIGIGAGASEVLLYSQDTGTSNGVFGSTADPNNRVASSFSPSQSALCTKLELYLSAPAGVNGTILITLEADSAGVPSGTPLCSWSVDADTLPTSTGAKQTLISSGANVSFGTTYWIVASPASLTGAGNLVHYYQGSLVASTQTKFSTNAGSSWGSDNTSYNNRFLVYGKA